MDIPKDESPVETNAMPPPESSIKELGITLQPDNSLPCLLIVGEIEGHMMASPQTKTTKYEHMIPLLVAAEQNPQIQGALVVLNTVGGDVEAGLALAEMISSLSKPTVSLVLGGGHSIGVTLAVSTHYSFITPTATMTVHPLRMSGMIITVAQTYEYFNKMQERVLTFVTAHSSIKREALLALMLATGELANDIGTVLVGQEAVDCGLINEVGGLSNALQKLKQLVMWSQPD